MLFTAASLMIPSPMFPGNVLCNLIGSSVNISQYASVVSALFNGILYSIVLWVIFVAVSRRLTREK
jgi:hypothetical protein